MSDVMLHISTTAVFLLLELTYKNLEVRKRDLINLMKGIHKVQFNPIFLVNVYVLFNVQD